MTETIWVVKVIDLAGNKESTSKHFGSETKARSYFLEQAKTAAKNLATHTKVMKNTSIYEWRSPWSPEIQQDYEQKLSIRVQELEKHPEIMEFLMGFTQLKMTEEKIY